MLPNIEQAGLYLEFSWYYICFILMIASYIKHGYSCPLLRGSTGGQWTVNLLFHLLFVNMLAVHGGERALALQPWASDATSPVQGCRSPGRRQHFILQVPPASARLGSSEIPV